MVAVVCVVIPLLIHSCGNRTNDVVYGKSVKQVQVISLAHQTPSKEGLAIPILGEIKPAWQRDTPQKKKNQITLSHRGKH